MWYNIVDLNINEMYTKYNRLQNTNIKLTIHYCLEL